MAEKLSAARNSNGIAAGNHAQCKVSLPANPNPISTTPTMTAYAVASVAAHNASPQTTCSSRTIVVNCPSQDFWKCMRMYAPKSDWKKDDMNAVYARMPG